MNANERNEIVKLIQPNILPNAVEIEVKVTEDEQVIEQVLPNEVVENIEEELVSLDIIADEDDDNEEVETEYDFSNCNKLELIEIL